MHRQLAYAIGYEAETRGVVDDGLRSKTKLEKVCQNLNFRHRNAQMAGRASIEYYVGQALKARGEKAPNAKIEVEGYVMRVFENGVVVFVPQFGVEGLVRLEDFELPGEGNDEEGLARERESAFDPESYSLRVFKKGHELKEVKVELFQQLKVRVSSEEKGGVREKGKRRVRIVVMRQ